MTDLTEDQKKRVKDFESEMDRLISKNIPEKYSDVDVEEIKKIGIGYKSYYIFGGVGTGKTRIGYGVVKAIIEKSFKEGIDKVKNGEYIYSVTPAVYFENFPKLLDSIRNEMNVKRDYGDDGIVDFISNYRGMVILDDLGAEKFTEWSIETLYKIVNERYEKELYTIFISNLSLSELAEKVGDRIVSRITEMCEIKKIDGEDRRLNKK